MSRLSADLRSVPNIVTISRIFLVAAAVPLFYAGYHVTAVVLGLLGGVSDHMDGILARKLGQETELGEVLDQFSDLVLETVCFLILIHLDRGAPPWVLGVYLFREFCVMTIRRYMARKQLPIKTSIWGKVKTNFIGWSFAPYILYAVSAFPEHDFWLGPFGIVGLATGLVISYTSAWGYTRQFASGYSSLAH